MKEKISAAGGVNAWPVDLATGRPSICLVLSTGRCGSTLLSNIVHAHPAVLSVSELFSALSSHNLSERELTGAGFWHMLSTSSQVDAVILRCQIELKEMLYPAFAPRPGANRFNWATGVPPLLQVTLPHLTNRPDDMYGSLEALTIQQPPRLLSEHLWWLFGELIRGQGVAVVVERSGGSLRYASKLLQLFPDAKVVHLFRDGRECAPSMSRHARYKLAAIRAAMIARFGYDPYGATEAADQERGRVMQTRFRGDEQLAELVPERITRACYDRFEVPLRNYGAMWSRIVAEGLSQLSKWSQVLTLDYDDLVSGPERSIGRLCEFLGVERDSGWEKQVAKQIRPARDVRSEIGEQQWTELTQACRLGMNRIHGRGGWN